MAVASAVTSTTRACASPGELDPLRIALGLRDRRALGALGATDLGLGLGFGRPDGRGDQLLLRPGGLELGELGLLAGDLLGRLGLGERTGLGGARLGGRGLGLGLGTAQGDVPLGVDLDLLGLGLADGGLLVGRRPWPSGRPARGGPSPAGR